ncbi:MAG: hypothetical protein IJX80_05755 [Clostridia bacterium]|nr:hypothetical protein [Clostridia bacterium]
MSLQNDFELCLEYEEALEIKQEQREQAQNGIIFMQNESERLKKKTSDLRDTDSGVSCRRVAFDIQSYDR